jgi:hypothetical protein
MNSIESILEPTFQELEDLITDFAHASENEAKNLLKRINNILEGKQIQEFLDAALPEIFDVQKWWDEKAKSQGTYIGSGSLELPSDLSERVKFQITVIHWKATQQMDFVSFILDYFSGGSNIESSIRKYVNSFLKPFIRDLRKLTKTSPIPPILLEAIGGLPESGDSELDGLLQVACAKFRDPAPEAHRDAVEKLWDSWERLKDIEIHGNKKKSVDVLLSKATNNQKMRELLDEEARSLTAIGNKFRIRHFEIDTESVDSPELYNYLFHRLYALIHLLLLARKDGAIDAES